MTMLLAALSQGNLPLVMATMPLAGCLLGFLRYNFNPASVFLGDSGSLSIGFLLGCYGVIWSHKSATLLGMTAPVMTLAIPLLDVVLSIARRILRRQPIFSADREHIHHKLLARGFTQRRVALVFYGLCAVAATFGLVQSVTNQDFAGPVAVLFCLLAWVGVRRLGYVEFGVAGKLLLPSNFLRLIGAQLRLRTLQDELACAEDMDQCWDAIAGACREFGFSRVVLRLAGTSREAWLGEREAPSTCWMLRVPLSDTDYVNIGNSFGSLVEPMFLSRFAAVLREVLEPRLPLLGGATAPLRPEPVPVLYRIEPPRARSAGPAAPALR